MSSPDGDSKAMGKLENLLRVAENHNSHVCLYPHFGAWLERVEDGVRLCQKMNNPRLKTVFCGFHWYAADGKGLAERIEEASPYLYSVICVEPVEVELLQDVQSSHWIVVKWTISLCYVCLTNMAILEGSDFKDTVLAEMYMLILSVHLPYFVIWKIGLRDIQTGVRSSINDNRWLFGAKCGNAE